MTANDHENDEASAARAGAREAVLADAGCCSAVRDGRESEAGPPGEALTVSVRS